MQPHRFPTPIETERLILRSYEAGDGAWYYTLSQRNQQHLARYERDNPLFGLSSAAEAERLIESFVSAWDQGVAYFIGAFERTTGNFAAQVYVGLRNSELPAFEIGYFADVQHEGRGYVREAVLAILSVLFSDLLAQRISLECDDTNLRSSRLAECCGFVREGHIRANKRHPDGSISGTLHYGLLRSEYHPRLTATNAREPAGSEPG